MFEVVHLVKKSSEITFSIKMLFGQIKKEIESNKGIKVKTIEANHYSNGLISIYKNLIQAYKLRHTGSDVFHITGDIHYFSLLLPKKRTILTIHDCNILEYTTKYSLKYWIFKIFWFDLPVRFSKVVTTISEKSKNEIINFTGCSHSHVKVIPNFLNPEFKYVAKKINNEMPSILFINSAPNKNLKKLANALKGIPCELQIVGIVSEEEFFLLEKNRIKYKISVNLSQKEMIGKYIDSDIIAFPSTYEGFGLPILEGQAVGRPVLTSNISPMKEVAGDGACLIDPFDVNSIRSGLLKIINDSKFCLNLIEKGLNNVKKYSEKEVSQQYYSLYEQIKNDN